MMKNDGMGEWGRAGEGAIQVLWPGHDMAPDFNSGWCSRVRWVCSRHPELEGFDTAVFRDAETYTKNPR